MASVMEPTVAEIDDVNPMGTDGFEFVEYTAPDPAALRRAVREHGLREGRQAPLQGRLALSPGRRELHPQRREGQLRPGLRPRARPQSICAIALPGEELRPSPTSGAQSLGAWGVEGKVGPMELNIPAIKGIGDSLIYLVDRYGERGTIYDVDFEYLPGVERNPKGVGPHLHRPPDAQRASRPHGRVGRVLRAALQFPRDPLLRHRGQAHRAEVQGDDQPVRQDPHPDQREHGRQVADRGISLRAYHGEGIQHIALGTDDIYDDGRGAARAQGRAVPGPPDTYYEQVDARLPGHGEDLQRLARRPHPDRRRADQGRRAAAADLHPERDRPDLLRDHPAQGQRRLRRGQFPRPVRIDRARPDPPRRAESMEEETMAKNWIPLRQVEGTASRQAHADLPEGTYEREISKEGFFGPGGASSTTSTRRPAGSSFEARCARAPSTSTSCDAGKAIPWAAAAGAAQRRICRCASGSSTQPMADAGAQRRRRRAAVRPPGRGELFCDYGHLDYRGRRLHRASRAARCGGCRPRRAHASLLIEATNDHFTLPDKGLVGPHAIFDPAMLDTPRIDEAFQAQQDERDLAGRGQAARRRSRP